MKQINLYLEGGGAKCIYQLSFIHKLLLYINNSNKYQLNSINTISFGSIIAFLILNNNYEHGIDIFTNDKFALVKSFDLGIIDSFIRNTPLIGKYFGNIIDSLWVLVGINKYGLFNIDNIQEIIHSIPIKDENMDNLKKLNIYVYNLTKNKIEVINGNHYLIKEYLIAAISCWLLFKPIKITKLRSECECNDKCINECTKITNDKLCHCSQHMYNEYMDAGFIYNVPIHCLQDNYSLTEQVTNCYLMTEDINDPIEINKGPNLLSFMFELIGGS
jgi:predicted acylesterase/phospholipase RssA